MKLVTSVVMNFLFCVILVTSTVSNSLLLLVFHRRPGLRTISNRFVINLLVTNLVTCWILIPLLVFDNIWREVGGSTSLLSLCGSLCPIKEGVAIGLCSATVFSVLMIGVDLYFAVLDPLRYHSSINATNSAVMIAVSWMAAVVTAVCGGLTTNYGRSSWYICEKARPMVFLPRPYQVIFPLFFAIVIFLLPFSSICWIYFRIYSAAHTNSQRTRRNGSTCAPEAAIADYIIVPAFNEDSDVLVKKPQLCKPLHHSSTKSSLKSTSSFIVNSLRHRISNASMFRYREETRAARISVAVIVMALLCWFPFTLVLVLGSPLINTPLSYLIKQIAILSLTSNAVVSPLIFAHRNKRIHKELCKLFCISKRRTSFYDSVHIVKRSRSNLGTEKPKIFPKSSILLTLSDPDNKSYKNPNTRSSLVSNSGWMLGKPEQEASNGMLTLPEVALDVETSRSSFSSNSSNASTNTNTTHRSTSAASFSDVEHL